MSSVFAGQSRDELRRGWVEAWRKGRARTLLTPLESAIVGIVDEHPEYHAALSDEAAARRVVREAADRWGRLDVVVNAATAAASSSSIVFLRFRIEVVVAGV